MQVMVLMGWLMVHCSRQTSENVLRKVNFTKCTIVHKITPIRIPDNINNCVYHLTCLIPFFCTKLDAALGIGLAFILACIVNKNHKTFELYSSEYNIILKHL